ncbi:MAG: response regulator [Gammaproteobacteria bacterium]|nr:response regulator [Gammaproteobacteria bacterium]MDH5735095.1 response regulator [Gammaproteobacteria bacterium]
MERKILLVDDEENIISSLVRLLRRGGYTIFTANSGKAGLEILNGESVGVIVSDQRMPEMCGVEFLSKAKDICPETIRIMLSGYTDLTSVTDAINRGAIYKFLTKPWDDKLLKENIDNAFQQYELAHENQRLTSELKSANHELNNANKELAELNECLSRYADINLRTLKISQEILENLPMGILGVGDDGMIALANQMAHQILSSVNGGMVGMPVEVILPKEISQCYQETSTSDKGFCGHIDTETKGTINVFVNRLGKDSQAKGTIIVLMPKGE